LGQLCFELVSQEREEEVVMVVPKLVEVVEELEPSFRIIFQLPVE
jgi:hypothetical protein